MGGRELSISLIGLAGGLLVGNFAAFSGFLALADIQGDQYVTWLLAGGTALLTVSIIFGGWGIGTPEANDPGKWYNLQAVAGLVGLLAALAMPLTSLWYREPPNSTQAAEISVLRQALAGAEADRIALQNDLTATQTELSGVLQTVNQLRLDLDVLSNP